ncbi:hypothetical protein PPTG_22358 [Phytophthora nicotianae INRA-310]|uniref:Uncharacterized protein n=1 Tax=Phytophthora nicotianae (strain INRA-310) TaxID=761204 RepID=W2QJT8_PHYN3|nr:hypothetical protein PPTG_22358 [Phytophthora nicotianae INRA-310]ETN13427.1 hypothetical protein PPTG_22358 [Phytophthora nicotianae INRA-310]
MSAAKNAIFRRDCYLAGRENNSDAEGNRLQLLNRPPQHSERFQDDLFRIDSVTLAVLMLPPSFDDARWPLHVLAFCCLGAGVPPQHALVVARWKLLQEKLICSIRHMPARIFTPAHRAVNLHCGRRQCRSSSM